MYQYYVRVLLLLLLLFMRLCDGEALKCGRFLFIYFCLAVLDLKNRCFCSTVVLLYCTCCTWFFCRVDACLTCIGFAFVENVPREKVGTVCRLDYSSSTGKKKNCLHPSQRPAIFLAKISRAEIVFGSPHHARVMERGSPRSGVGVDPRPCKDKCWWCRRSVRSALKWLHRHSTRTKKSRRIA